jgi:hypothetical protein
VIAKTIAIHSSHGIPLLGDLRGSSRVPTTLAGGAGFLQVLIFTMSKKLSDWSYFHGQGNEAEHLGVVSAADAQSAIKATIKECALKDEQQQKRLAARPDE